MKILKHSLLGLMAFRLSNTFSTSACRLPAALLAVLFVGDPSWCQTEQSAPTAKSAKQVAKERWDALKQADKAIKKGEIDQVRAMLQADPELAVLPMAHNALAEMATAPIIGAPLAHASGSGVTLLMKAVDYNRKDAAELLLEYHADINARDGWGQTPLHHAVLTMVTDLDLIRLLLDHGADPNTRRINGETPLGMVLWAAATFRDKDNHMRDVKELLLQHGAHK